MEIIVRENYEAVGGLEAVERWGREWKDWYFRNKTNYPLPFHECGSSSPQEVEKLEAMIEIVVMGGFQAAAVPVLYAICDQGHQFRMPYQALEKDTKWFSTGA